MGKFSKSDVVNIILLVNSLVWYLCSFSFLTNNTSFTGNNLVVIIGINLVTTFLAAVLGIQVIQKIKSRTKIIVSWLAMGVFLTLLILLIDSSFFDFTFLPNVIGPHTQDFSIGASFFEISLISGIVGTYCGFGFPVLLGHYTATTKSVNRAKVSGIIIFITSLSFAAMTLFVHNSISAVIVLTFCKLFGLIAVLFLKPSEVKINEKEKVSYKTVLKTRSMMLYLIPWLMFSIVNTFALPALNIGFDGEFINSITLVENVLAGIFAVIFGFVADRFGRKRLLFFGFTMIGLGYAALGLFSLLSMYGLYFYILADGIAWGIFAMLFVLTIWGDIADKRDSEKFFVIGFLPFVISAFMQVLFGQFVVDTLVDLTNVFFFISILLFIAVTPLYFAPETLPEKDKKEDELKAYLEEAIKRVERESSKRQWRKQAVPLVDDSESYDEEREN
ncbi:MAG: MFS transporter [Candidatus Bathyarchaeota archaeon]|nr:MFS transporter [Candidatus Termiticorpusculum sp.]